MGEITYEIQALDHELDAVQRRTLAQIVDHYEAAVTAAGRRGMERAALIGIPMPIGPYSAQFKDGFLTAIEVFAAAIRADMKEEAGR